MLAGNKKARRQEGLREQDALKGGHHDDAA
jgi:hypothetical protein